MRLMNILFNCVTSLISFVCSCDIASKSLKLALRIDYNFPRRVFNYLRMFGWLSWFISCTSLSMFVRFERFLFNFNTITLSLVLWVTWKKKYNNIINEYVTTIFGCLFSMIYYKFVYSFLENAFCSLSMQKP